MKNCAQRKRAVFETPVGWVIKGLYTQFYRDYDFCFFGWIFFTDSTNEIHHHQSHHLGKYVELFPTCKSPELQESDVIHL